MVGDYFVSSVYDLHYQLNCNTRHDTCFYITIRESSAAIHIWKYSGKSSVSQRFLPLSFHPISSGWVDEKIYLLSESALYSLNLCSDCLSALPLPESKIVDILSLSIEGDYLYVSMIDPDWIDFYRKSEAQTDVKLASYHIFARKLNFSGCPVSSAEQNHIEKYIVDYQMVAEEGICDSYDGHELKIVRTSLYSELYSDGICLKRIFGCIDRAFYFGDTVIYSSSSLASPTEIQCFASDDSIVDRASDVSADLDHISVSYCSEACLPVYHYRLGGSFPGKGFIFMLHGGPAGRYSNRFDPMAYAFAEAGFTVFLVNYPGSTGYGQEYQTCLYGKAGTEDCRAVTDCLSRLAEKYKEIPTYLVGDSYGGYLAILISLKSENAVQKTYAVNAFTDIRHQFLFSRARHIIAKYFPDIRSLETQAVNPIDLTQNGQLKDRLLIINGSNDSYCPKEQIVQFANLSKCDVVFLPDYPHYMVDYLKTNQISQVILRDIGE